jgi:hypothetical protein
LGISLRRRKAIAPAAAVAPTPAPPHRNEDKKRQTANEWARELKVNEVMAERAAMRSDRWHDLFTEEEFMELLSKQDV